MALSPLHKAPLGLLELFRLKTLGRAPEFFGDTVLPMTDVAEFYSQPIATTSAPTVGAYPVVETLALSGPVRLRSLSGDVLNGAAAATNVIVDIGLIDPNGTTCPLASIYVPNLPAATRLPVSVQFPKPLVLAAGYSLYCRAQGTAAGADHSATVIGLIDNITSTAG